MAALQEFLALLEREYPDPKIRGKKFEPFLRDALKASPSHQFTEVWCWEDAPCYDGPDRGIDLVAKDINGGLWGIQSKLYDPEQSLGWKELSTWVGATRTDQWAGRLLVSTSSNLTPNAKKELLDDEKTLMLLGADLFELSVDWSDTIESKVKRHEPLKPKDHQEDAIKAITSALSSGQERVQAHMACGTGKTLVSLRVFEAQNSDLSVVLVPSISLMQQTIRSWTANAVEAFTYLPVCSDVKVAEDKRRGEDDDLLLDDLTSLDSPATTNPDIIAAFLNGKGRRVVFCTYQSSDVLAEVAQATNTTFDLVVADEAHRTTGPVDSLFATALDNTKFPANKRVFLTATPRLFTTTDDGDETVASMDDPDRYGDVVYTLSFGEAVDLKELADYEVIVVAVDDPELRDLILNGGSLELEGLNRKIEGSTLTALEGTLQAVSEFGMTKIISFHSRIKRANDFALAVPVFDQWRKTPVDARSVTVNGKMNAATRKKQVGWLEKGDDQPHILTNARCLTEGIDVPSLDAIVFADPRRSQIDIVQAVGRVMRTNPNNPDKIGRIIIPLVVPNEEDIDGDDVFKDSSFKPVWDVIRALKAHDFRLETELNRLRGLSALGPVSPEEFEEVTRLRVIGIQALEAFHLRVLEKSTASFWWWLQGPLSQFIEKNGHLRPKSRHVEDFQGEELNIGNWVGSRRKEYKAGKLSAERIAVLEALPGWEWDPFEADYQKSLGALKQFIEREGHANPPPRCVEDFQGEELNLGNWVSKLRNEYKAGKLSAERAVALEEIPGWEWDPFEADFQKSLGALKQFVEREGHAKPLHKYVEDFQGEKLNLGTWVTARRKDYKAGKLSAERAVALEEIPGWEWDPLEADYQKKFAALKQYVDREGHANPPQRYVEDFQGEEVNIGKWVGQHRINFKTGRTGRLSKERAAVLEALPGWEWDPLEANFPKSLGALKQFVEREGHSMVPRNYVEVFQGEELNLGNWVANHMSWYRTGKLSEEKAAALEEIPGWEWNRLEADYQKRLGALKQFVEREGHASPHPIKYIEDFQGEELNIGSWVSSRRKEYREGKLSAERIAVLEALPGWEWDPFEANYQKRLGALKQFVEREGHANPPPRCVEDFQGEKLNLYNWVGSRRKEYKAGKLSAERIAVLEALPGWEWSVR